MKPRCSEQLLAEKTPKEADVHSPDRSANADREQDTTAWLKGLADPDDPWATAAPTEGARVPDMPSRERRPVSGAVWIAVGLALLLAGGALVAAAFLFGGDEGPTSGASGDNADMGAVTGSPDVSSPNDTGTASPGGEGGAATTPTSTPGASTPRPTAPAPPGAELETLGAAPAKTIALVNLPEGFTSASWKVTFEPYGWGPGGQEGGRLVIRVVAAEPEEQAGTVIEELTGANLSVWADRDAAAAVTGGGTYTGVVSVRPQADVGSLVLQSAAAKQ